MFNHQITPWFLRNAKIQLANLYNHLGVLQHFESVAQKRVMTGPEENEIFLRQQSVVSLSGKLTFETHVNPNGDRYLSRKMGDGPEMLRGCTSDVDGRIRVFDSLMSEAQIVIPGHIVHFGTLSPDSPDSPGGAAPIVKSIVEARSVSSLDGSLTAPSGISISSDISLAYCLAMTRMLIGLYELQPASISSQSTTNGYYYTQDQRAQVFRDVDPVRFSRKVIEDTLRAKRPHNTVPSTSYKVFDDTLQTAKQARAKTLIEHFNERNELFNEMHPKAPAKKEMPISFYIDMGQEDENHCLAVTVASKDFNRREPSSCFMK